jgi:hypothetical protein
VRTGTDSPPTHPEGSADRRPAAAWPGVGEPVPSLPSYLRWHRWRRRCGALFALQHFSGSNVSIFVVFRVQEKFGLRVLRNDTPRKLAPNVSAAFSPSLTPFILTVLRRSDECGRWLLVACRALAAWDALWNFERDATMPCGWPLRGRGICRYDALGSWLALAGRTIFDAASLMVQEQE